jgi:hypothetical protein
MKRLHDAGWNRVGALGNTVDGCTLSVSDAGISVTQYLNGKKSGTYRLHSVYADLVKRAYAQGLAQKPLVP